MSVEDVTAAALKLSDDQFAAGKAAQLAVDQPLVDGLKADLLEMTGERDAVQGRLDEYVRTHPDTPPPPPPPPPPAKTTIFGGYGGPIVQDRYDARAAMSGRFATALGVTVLPAERVYSETGFGVAATSTSKIVGASYKQVPGLAAGTASVITAVTNELRALDALAAKTGQVIDVALDHEVDNKLKRGDYTMAQLVAAHARFVQIVRSIGSKHLRIAWCTMAWSYLPANASQPWYPPSIFTAIDGHNAVDVLTPDGYYTANYKTPDAILGPLTTWMLAQGKPFAIWECGWWTAGQADPKYTEQQRVDRVQAQLDWWRKNGADYVLWFEANKSTSNNLLEGHPAALSVYAGAAQGK